MPIGSKWFFALFSVFYTFPCRPHFLQWSRALVCRETETGEQFHHSVPESSGLLPTEHPPPVPREERRRAWWLWPPFPSPSVFRPSTPPPKPVAFEDFKNERGSEINRIFKENKSILNERRKRASETTQRINAIKREMDMTKEALNFQKSLREKQGECWWEGGWGLWELSHPALNGAVLSPGGWRWEGAGGACGGVVFTPVSSCGSNQP